MYHNNLGFLVLHMLVVQLEYLKYVDQHTGFQDVQRLETEAEKMGLEHLLGLVLGVLLAYLVLIWKEKMGLSLAAEILERTLMPMTKIDGLFYLGWHFHHHLNVHLTERLYPP